VTGATKALLYTEGSPRFPYDYVMPENRNLDVFDFLHYVFCFQKDNVANQREHLILLLASSQSRKGILHHGQRTEVLLTFGCWVFFFQRFSLANFVVILPKGRALKLQVMAVLLPW
jgi:hypothetical protein